MWWLELGLGRRGLFRLAGICAASALLAGCFQPLYGEHTVSGGPGISTALSGVEVSQINAAAGSPEARVAVELRNQLLFNLTGGSAAAPPAYRLNIRMTSQELSVIVDITSGRPDVQDYGINATYNLVDIKTGKSVMTASTFARVSYDIPGQEQRFARARGQRDAQNRAAKAIADNIKARLASYFVAGT